MKAGATLCPYTQRQPTLTHSLSNSLTHTHTHNTRHNFLTDSSFRTCFVMMTGVHVSAPAQAIRAFLSLLTSLQPRRTRLLSVVVCCSLLFRCVDNSQQC